MKALELKNHFNEILSLNSNQQSHWAKDLSGDLSSNNNQNELNLEVVKKQLCDIPLNLQNRIVNELFSLGPIEALVLDKDIDEILIHGLEAISFERHGKLYPYDDYFLAESSSTFLTILINKSV
jgi:Flp pilus assembly CpaF family ATPase